MSEVRTNYQEEIDQLRERFKQESERFEAIMFKISEIKDDFKTKQVQILDETVNW